MEYSPVPPPGSPGVAATAEPGRSHAPAGGSSDPTALAKESQNPVANLISVPFQFNFFTGGALGDRTLYNLNFQPVLPLKLTGDVTLIARTIVPILDMPIADPDTGEDARESGLGDIQQQYFLTPASSGRLTWGLGPILSYPVATNDLVRTGDWGAGPTGVLVVNAGNFLIGVLATQLWTYAGDDEGPNLNQLTLQPFINFNLPDGWAISTAPLITANWSAPSDQTWTIPLGLGFSKVTAIGRQMTSLGLQFYENVEYPSTTGREQVRLVASFLFPEAPSAKK